MQESFDVLPCGYISFSDDGIIGECNLTLASWLGYAKSDLKGKSIENILTLASRIFYNTHLFPLIKLHSRASEIFVTLLNKQNSHIPVLLNAHRISVAENSNIHCVFIRVEERKKFEQELIEARREAENIVKENRHLIELKAVLEKHTLVLERQHQHLVTMNDDLLQFSKIISHDLQEPIHKIQVFVDLLARDKSSRLSPRSRTLQEKISAAAVKLHRLTSSLDQYISLDTKRTPSEVDLNLVVEKARSRAIEEREFLEFDLHIEQMPSIDGHEGQLELLFFHLIDNAIQFRDPSRRLVIKVNHVVYAENIFKVSENQYKYEDHVRISFEDNGIGFPEEYTSYVFILLKKINNSTGLGIGLPLAKKIVQNHFGQIRVKSQPGTGTEFEIELPLKSSTH